MDAERLERAVREALPCLEQMDPPCDGVRWHHAKAIRAAIADQEPAPNCLAPMTPEQRAAFKPLTGAEIDAALSEGKRNADAVRTASGGLPGAFSAPAPNPAQAVEAVAWEATGRYGGAPATEYGDSEENARWIYRVRYGAMPDEVRPLVYAAPTCPGGAA